MRAQIGPIMAITSVADNTRMTGSPLDMIVNAEAPCSAHHRADSITELSIVGTSVGPRAEQDELEADEPPIDRVAAAQQRDGNDDDGAKRAHGCRRRGGQQLAQ